MKITGEQEAELSLDAAAWKAELPSPARSLLQLACSPALVPPESLCPPQPASHSLQSNTCRSDLVPLLWPSMAPSTLRIAPRVLCLPFSMSSALHISLFPEPYSLKCISTLCFYACSLYLNAFSFLVPLNSYSPVRTLAAFFSTKPSQSLPSEPPQVLPHLCC